jgi:glycosyltransferase involved in cell wall biosynthesis
MKALVSIVCPLFNYAHFVTDLIKSVTAQEYENWELVIIDDGSTDKPLDAIGSFLQDERIRYHSLGRNHGYSTAKNEGIVRCRGEYISVIDADDQLLPCFIPTMLPLLKNPKILWAHAEAYILSMQDQAAGFKQLKGRIRAIRIMREEKKYDAEYATRIHSQTVMAKRQFYVRLGLYDESLPFSSDKEMWQRALAYHVIPSYAPTYVSVYRKHESQMHRSEFKQSNQANVAHQIKKHLRQRIKGINSQNTRLLPKTK